ncbi:MAG TPA: diphthine--ammonia ligase [Blastocatellia bacterium]|nr:diphthine--ammonia ligase [Blastocatellia bacterium]
MKERVLVSWSGGKDSSMALYEIQKTGQYEIVALVTTVTDGYDRISMHGVRRSLLERQVESLGLPLHTIHLSMNATNEEYESKMKAALEEYRRNGVQTVVFGDIFLEDIRRYREDFLSKIGMKGAFPIWRRDTNELARTFITMGFKAIVVCVDTKVLDRSFAGQMIEEEFLRRLPPGVDPCGENGEFHSFVFDGPIFTRPVTFTIGETVLRDSFCFRDLVPA